MSGLEPDGSVEDQFFLRIALKNGLLSAQQASAIQASLAPGQRVQDLVLERQLLDRAAVDRIREAMAASQVMRLDALYAELLLERGLVADSIVESAFAEQRRQHYRVRIGNLLLQRGLISPEHHREVISEVIRRLRSLGQDAYSSASRSSARREAAPRSSPPPPPPPPPPPSPPSPPPPLGHSVDPFGASSVERSPLAADPPPPPSPSPPSRRPDSGFVPQGLQSASGAEQASPFASRRLQSDDFAAPAPSEEPIRIPLNETMEAVSAFRGDRSSALFEPAARRLLRESPRDDLTRSAIRIDLEGEGFDVEADASLLRSDLNDSVARWAGGSEEGESDSFVLDKGDLAGDGFQPEEYLRRRQVRGRLLIAAGVLAALGVLGVVVTAAAQVLENRGRLTAARGLVQDAFAAEKPEQRQRLLQRAETELNRIGRSGVSVSDKTALAELIAWGLLRTDAEASLAAGKPRAALELLEQRAESVPASQRDELARLRARCEREELSQAGRQAEEDQDWGLAVSCYRSAAKLGDPGGLANQALQRIRARLSEERSKARARLAQSLSRQDEANFNGLQRLLSDLFGAPPDESLDLDELRHQRKRGEVLAQARGRLTQIEELERVAAELRALLSPRPGDQEVQAVLKQIELQLRVRGLELEGRRAEQRGQLQVAIDSYRAASKEADPGVQRQLEQAIARCEARLRGQAEHEVVTRKREQSVAFLRRGEVSQAAALLEEIAEQDPRAKRLLGFARQVRGCAYVPAGPFLQGSKSGLPEERPQREVTLPAYFISQTEVSNADYAEFLDTRPAEVAKTWTPRHWTQPRRRAGGVVEGKIYPSAIQKHPVVYVTWPQAQAFAAARGGRLPSEAEWEKAARGSDGRTFPWGEGPRSRVQVQVANSGGRAPTAPVGALADDRSPYGVYDMAGNVHEWTADEFVPYPGAPAGVQGRPGRKVLRGGAWRWPLEDARTTRRQSATPDYANDRIGFRFVIDVPQDLPELR